MGTKVRGMGLLFQVGINCKTNFYSELRGFWITFKLTLLKVKEDKMINQIKYSLLLFLFLSILICLFPPFTLKDGTKFYDFIFNQEERIFTRGSYDYSVDTNDRELNSQDSIDALSIKYTTEVDTFYKYTPIPGVKPHKKKIFQSKYWDILDSNYKQEIDKIESHKIFTITKPYYLHSSRHLLLYQFIIHFIIAIIISFVFFLIYPNISKKQK
jgi:hypothetical protein